MLKLLCILLFSMIANQAVASPLKGALANAQLRGEATFRYLGLPIYVARLFTRSGKPYDGASDVALEFTYRTNLSRDKLVNSTMSELSRLGPDLAIRDQLRVCFRDIRAGDRYLAVSRGADQILFWHNNAPTCTLRHSNIRSRFMAIFLGDNTRSRRFTQALRGQ